MKAWAENRDRPVHPVRDPAHRVLPDHPDPQVLRGHQVRLARQEDRPDRRDLSYQVVVP